MGWSTVRPSENCVFCSATRMNKVWLYEVWEIRDVGVNEEPTLLNNRGQYAFIELSELKADKYLILSKHE